MAFQKVGREEDTLDQMDKATKERIALKKGMAQAHASLMKFKQYYQRLHDEGTDDAVKLAKAITPGEN